MKLGAGARRAVAGAMALSTIAAAAPAQAPGLVALGQIELGQWQLRESAPGMPTFAVCVSDPAMLIQLRHRHAQCARFVIENSPTVATVHYTCPGSGHGRTTVTVETPRLVRIETQGVADGQPFASEYEGRRIGPCAKVAGMR